MNKKEEVEGAPTTNSNTIFNFRNDVANTVSNQHFEFNRAMDNKCDI